MSFSPKQYLLMLIGGAGRVQADSVSKLFFFLSGSGRASLQVMKFSNAGTIPVNTGSNRT